MEEIRLVTPAMEYAEDILAFRGEIFAAHDKDDFSGCSSLERYENVEDWLRHLEELEHRTDKVPSDNYLAVRLSDKRIVGIIDLRHSLDHPVLALWGGHIGYSVRPSERRKGYGKAMLGLCLDKARERGLEKVMVTCDRENSASARTILANGGVFEKEVEVDGTSIQRYWITLT
ncbi:MAG: GNAT family N-acetyltransferase [Oscillospiraceae bacterium]